MFGFIDAQQKMQLRTTVVGGKMEFFRGRGRTSGTGSLLAGLFFLIAVSGAATSFEFLSPYEASRDSMDVERRRARDLSLDNSQAIVTTINNIRNDAGLSTSGSVVVVSNGRLSTSGLTDVTVKEGCFNIIISHNCCCVSTDSGNFIVADLASI